jgi:hypothetical protein
MPSPRLFHAATWISYSCHEINGSKRECRTPEPPVSFFSFHSAL